MPAVDGLRGLVMIIMALDHTRDFFHSGAKLFQPEDLTRTTTALFLTRWVTHICAPVFMFTAGLGAYFWLSRGRRTNQLSGFLWKRGVWLIFLEVTVLRYALTFNMFSGPILLTILWALGWSMVALGVLVHLPVRILAILSVLAIALHNFADPVTAAQFGKAAWVWNVLHQQGLFQLGGISFLSAYPLAPWFAVMALGFCFGPIMTLDPAGRRYWLTRIGLVLIGAFFLIRGINVYGDPARWSSQIPGMTVLSFLRCTKYPPSLDFLLMTLGPALLLLAWLDRAGWTKKNPLIVFGRVPLFYFIAHIYIIHGLTIPFAYFRSISMGAAVLQPDPGYDLWVTYVVWLAVVSMLYPLCLWFARLKERRSDWWLAYL